jgi:hypothetical protein
MSIFTMLEVHMKQWFAAHILSTEDIWREESLPISNSEFVTSLSLVAGALAMFTFIIHLLGA